MVEMGQIQESTMETRFVGICKWREDQEQPIVGWSPTEKRVLDAVEGYLEDCANSEIGHLIFWSA